MAVDDGVVLDRTTGLEWTSRDQDQALTWDAADRHCGALALGARTGWRLPEITELEALFDRRFDVPCGEHVCHLDPVIGLRGPYVWSGTERGRGARFYFDFTHRSSLSPGLTPVLVRRVLCVRARPET